MTLNLDCEDCGFSGDVEAEVHGSGAGAVVTVVCPGCGIDTETEAQYL